ncbi:MAG: hypothetical protein EOO43_07090 [Flavobacterium sp.]|nr:MAG: hypothetical protein EOO43_07090 [Flavobacterium sp.]
MKLDDFVDHYNYFFKFTSWCFKPYLKRKHHPEQKSTFEYKAQSIFIWLGTWLAVVLTYILFVYFFLYEPADGKTRGIEYIKSTAIMDLLRDLYQCFNTSIYAHSGFVVLLYLTVQYRAERDYFKPLVLHADLSGLIKVIKTGSFDDESHIVEQTEEQIQIARKNIIETVSSNEKELIRIITASGWDFFGAGRAMPPIKEVKIDKGDSWFAKRKKRKEQNKIAGFLMNGYLLDIIKKRSKTVEIVLLDPDCEAARERARQYSNNNSHHAVKSEDEYIQGIRTCIKNLKVIAQDNSRIKLRLVDRVPRWKVILVGGEVWAQPIIEGKRSDHTPLYGFKKNSHSLYHFYFNLVDSYWVKSKAKEVDLSASDSESIAIPILGEPKPGKS